MKNSHSVLFALTLLAFFPSDGWSQGQTVTRIRDYTLVRLKDPVTDAESVVLMTRSKNGLSLKALSWSCSEDGYSVGLVTKPLGGDSNSRIRVLFRFPPTPATQPQPWDLAPDHKLIWMPKNMVMGFTEEAKTAETVIFRVTDPRDGVTMTSHFSLMGLTEGLNRLGCDSGEEVSEDAHVLTVSVGTMMFSITQEFHHRQKADEFIKLPEARLPSTDQDSAGIPS